LRRRLAWAAVVVLVAAATVVAVVTLRDEKDVEGPVLTTDLIAVRADVTPHEHLFGDRLTARVDVLLDRAFVKPETVRVVENFAPFRVDGQVKRERSDLGDTTHLTFSYPLVCRRGGPCLPREEGRTYLLPEVRVSYIVTEIGDRQTTRVPLAPLSGGSRLLGANLNEPVFRADAREEPPPTYRVSPTLLAVAALGLAGLLVLGALVLILPLVPVAFVQRRLAARRARRRTDLERALEHVRATTPAGGSEEVRPALERLATELNRAESDDLAVQTRRLAWSEPPPVEDELGGLEDDVEKVIAEGRSNGR
jgi:hypothetical protein